jgi:hypothetical protein
MTYCSNIFIRAQNAPEILIAEYIYYLSQIRLLLTDIYRPDNSVLSVHRLVIARSTGSNRIGLYSLLPKDEGRSILRNVLIFNFIGF